jgi:predicted phosphate transport protein (TIGR00153 family)
MKLFRKKPDFFNLLFEQSQKVLEGLRALKEFAYNQCDECAEKVNSLEKEGDEYRRILIEELNRTLATPIDREDIFQLSRALDDVLDYANSTVVELEIYGVKADDHVKRMIGIMIDAAEELTRSVKFLKEYPKIANDHAVKAKKFENFMEKAYRLALSDLFQGKDPIYMLKMREIYRHLSNCADRGDEAANIILSIVMKST